MTMVVHVVGPRNCDRSNGGLSKVNDTLLVVENAAMVPEGPTQVMVLEQHAPGAVSLRPLNDPWSKNKIGPMAGGNYAVGDDRFNETVERLLGTKFYGAVAIHDRFESEEMHYQLGH